MLHVSFFYFYMNVDWHDCNFRSLLHHYEKPFNYGKLFFHKIIF
jgi:hypothetical protein